MKGRTPQTLLTDQNIWLKEAVANQMPGTKHAVCVWHIMAKFSDWFSVLLGSRYDEWKEEFYHLYRLQSVDEFETEWRTVISKYELQGNKHIISLYSLRAFWALPFLRGYFFAGFLISWQREAINAFIQRISSAQSELICFVDQVAEIVESSNQTDKQKIQRKSQKLDLKTGSPIESHAASILTPFAFTKLQVELLSAPQYACLLVDDGCFEVKHHNQMEEGCKVEWVPCEEHISCSCQHYEFSGILCRHALRVLSSNNCFQIPDQYLPVRWRSLSFATISRASSQEHSNKIQLLESMASTLVAEASETDERLDLAFEQIARLLYRVRSQSPSVNVAAEITYNCPSDSLILPHAEDDGIQGYTRNTHDPFSSEKLKEKRTTEGIDIGRKRKQYSGHCYGNFVHDMSHYQLTGDDGLNGDALGFL